MNRRIVRPTALLAVAALCFSGGWFIGSSDESLLEALHATTAQLRSHYGVSCAGAEAEIIEAFKPVDVREPGEVSVLLVGDLLPLEDRDYLRFATELISSADIAIGNLEAPISRHGRPTPLKFDERGRVIHNEFIFRCPPSQAQRLADAGFDGMTLANNHIMDYGGEALLATLRKLDEVGMKYAGAGRDMAAAREPMIFDVAGHTLAILSYVDCYTLPGTEYFAATDQLAGTVFVHGCSAGQPTEQTRQMLENDLRNARERADLVLVSFHWGSEVTRQPDPFPQNLARLCIDAGADLVFGHHPHVLQGVEIYQGRPVIYSLGNFVFPTKWESNHYSAALEVRIKEGTWEKLIFHPVKLRFRAGDPVPARGEDLHKIVNRITGLSAQFGTECVFENVEGNPTVVIRNPSPPEPRTALLKKEEEHFFHEAHPELSGMSTVHFLAWDLADEGKVAKQRTVVVKSSLAAEVMEIFAEIYLAPERFPIHEVVGYNYRTVAGGSGLSYHALGRAIDINRAENPMIEGGRKIVHPDEPPYEPGEWRPGEDPYSITPDGSVVKAFKSRGWRWGGDWYSVKDYQHFDLPGR